MKGRRTIIERKRRRSCSKRRKSRKEKKEANYGAAKIKAKLEGEGSSKKCRQLIIIIICFKGRESLF